MKKKCTVLDSDFFLILLLIGIALIQLLPFFHVNITSGDDFEYCTAGISGQNPLEMAWVYAKGQGRFFSIFNFWQSYVMYAGENFILSKILQYGAIVLNIVLLSILLKKCMQSNAIAYLFILSICAFLCISPYTNPIICYPLVFSVSFSFFIGSLLLLQRFLEKQKRKDLLMASLLYCLSLLNYEVYTVFILIPLLFIVFYSPFGVEIHNLRQDIFSRKKIRTSLAFIIPLGVYLFIYFVFRSVYPSQYDGSMISLSSFSFSNVWKLLLNLNKTTLPAYVFFSEPELIKYYLPHSIRTLSVSLPLLVKSVLILSAFGIILKKIRYISYSKLYVGLGISFISLFLPHLLLALTPKYQFYATSFQGYTTSYFSFFAMASFLSFLCVLIFQLLRTHKLLQKIVMSLLVLFYVTASLLSSYANECLSRDYRLSGTRIDAIDAFCASPEGQAIQEHTILYAPLLWESSAFYGGQLTSMHTEICFENYMSAKLKRKIYICRTLERVSEERAEHPNSEIYQVDFKENQAFVLLNYKYD